MNHLTLKLVSFAEATTEIQSIRQIVFQVEQGVDPALEFDGLDDAATHIIVYAQVYDQKQPIGTARIRYLSDRLAKIERVAVLSAYRGQGIGKRIMEEAIAWLSEKGISEVKLNAQTHAKAFYAKLGFLQHGDEFDEAGIPHIEMRRPVEVAVKTR